MRNVHTKISKLSMDTSAILHEEYGVAMQDVSVFVRSCMRMRVKGKNCDIVSHGR